ncbi:iron ABC transporter substrate-binding protein [Pseudodesulfovibrio nedwellii]|uniref:Iron ABC transporter substrate-binding protein n=1 Tax=Pseudodesulfovibrio nedwellii TaxID=2973072 RepID=A0ABM8AZL1_9BACT|nr:iron ABC transporter substrate-binding protein [Pseudodesulfovibrio nedwellii]BDQ36966.1 iron ABC transporter substrate-binding protein [Pseudodesulfovibrio nedwellii]
MKNCICVALLILTLVTSAIASSDTRPVTDGANRTVQVPKDVQRVICSGPGCLRLLTYLQAQSMVVAVDDIESETSPYDARPYAMANPQFTGMPMFGEFRGHDNPELILTLEPQPQVIFKTYANKMGYDPIELQQKTGIPVVTLTYGNLGKLRPQFYQALRTMAEVIGKQERAEEVIAYFEAEIAELKKRTTDIAEEGRPSVFIGGVAFKGPHGFQSTEPAYPPFAFINANNLAYNKGLTGKELSHSDVSKEMIVAWNPDILFLDLMTMQLGNKAGGLYELRNDPAYRSLTAVSEGKVYGVLPYNCYSKNYGSILANAFYIGKLLYPDRFTDVDPIKKADEIYQFLVGKPVFELVNQLFQGYVFTPVPVN